MKLAPNAMPRDWFITNGAVEALTIGAVAPIPNVIMM